MIPLTLFLFYIIVLPISGLVPFYMNFRINLPISKKTLSGILKGIALNLEIHFLKN
jgi:hypothetical protein